MGFKARFEIAIPIRYPSKTHKVKTPFVVQVVGSPVKAIIAIYAPGSDRGRYIGLA